MSSHLWRYNTQTNTNTNHAIARNTELFMLSLSQILINNQSYCGIKTNIPITPEARVGQPRSQSILCVTELTYPLYKFIFSQLYENFATALHPKNQLVILCMHVLARMSEQ